MVCGNLVLVFFLLTSCIYLNNSQLSNENTFQDYCSNDCQIRYARLRCLQQYPQADIFNYTNSTDTQCYLQCFVYKTGLMNLKSRGLNIDKFLDIWDNIEEAFEEDNCMTKFIFDQYLSGKCSDYYNKLMEFRLKCLELFEYTFSVNSTWKSQDSKDTKSIDQSATEFCDSIDMGWKMATETSQYEDISLRSQYKNKLQCIFQNFHYIDAYGRVDESEILLSFEEAQEDNSESRNIINKCSHRANSKFQHDYYGDMAEELQNCLKELSSSYTKIFKQRDEFSKQY